VRECAEGYSLEIVSEADLDDLLPLMRAYCDFYETAPSDAQLLALSRALPPHLGAEIVDFTLDEGTIKLDGMADSFATVDRVKKALDLNGYFRDIQVTHATAGSDPSKVEFRLTAAIRGDAME